MGTFVIDFSDSNNPYFQTPDDQEMMRRYLLSSLQMQEVRARLTYSRREGCSLNLIYCSERLKCHINYRIIQMPVLGFSTKHQAVIVDPSDWGERLDKSFESFRPSTMTNQTYTLGLRAGDHTTSLVDFEKSLLLFDVVSTARWEGPDPRPRITTRWFIKFDLVESERDFQRRPPVEGVGYQLTRRQATPEKPAWILRQRIFKDGQIRPVRYYVKNVPSDFRDDVRRGFEYWHPLFVSLVNHPVLSYHFIQGDFDGEKEILMGDVRFNVLEWTYTRQAYDAKNNSIFNRNTGELLSSNITFQGSQIIDLYQKWFEYSEFVRNHPFGAIPGSNILFQNLFEDSFQAPHREMEEYPLYRTILLPLFPANEDVSDHISRAITYVVAHDVGHTLGLGHNYKGSLFGNDRFAGNTMMDIYSIQDRYKLISSEYDKMALAYGYLGVLPERTDWFCGQKDLINDYFYNQREQSPECSTLDGSTYPLERATQTLQDIVALLVGRSHSRAIPYLRWNVQVQREVRWALNNILFFYFSAQTHYDQLQSVFIDGRRPANPQELRDYVRNILSDIVCNPKLDDIFHLEGDYRRANPYDRQLQRNVQLFLELAKQTITPYINDFQC